MHALQHTHACRATSWVNGIVNQRPAASKTDARARVSWEQRETVERTKERRCDERRNERRNEGTKERLKLGANDGTNE